MSCPKSYAKRRRQNAFGLTALKRRSTSTKFTSCARPSDGRSGLSRRLAFTPIATGAWRQPVGRTCIVYLSIQGGSRRRAHEVWPSASIRIDATAQRRCLLVERRRRARKRRASRRTVSDRHRLTMLCVRSSKAPPKIPLSLTTTDDSRPSQRS